MPLCVRVQVRIHGASVNGGAAAAAVSLAPGTAFVYQELTRQEAHLYVHECTAVPPHFLPLVAARQQLPNQVGKPHRVSF